jgi:branched-chain amino acid transport system ATP-binding protein
MRYTCRTLIDQIGETERGGVSIIRIEHVVHALVTSIDRLLVLHNGVFVADGDPQNLAVAEIYLGIESDV